MARGWESKSVESQIESAELRHVRADRFWKTTEQLRREHECASIELTRTRVLHDLEAATHPRHRQQLEAALRHIEQQIEALKSSV
jgi:hypothetical protein